MDEFADVPTTPITLVPRGTPMTPSTLSSLDQVYARERQRADKAERSSRLIGEWTDDPLIQATRQAIKTGTQAKEFVQSGLEKAGNQIAKDVVPILEDPRMEAIGLGVTTGGVTIGNPVLTATGLGMLGTIKAGKGLLRPRFNVEEIMQQALHPTPLAERVTGEVNKKTAVLTDEEAYRQAEELLKSGGVSREALVNYIPGTAMASPAHSLAAQKIVTTESRNFLDTTREALAANDEQLAEQALAQLSRLIDPGSSVAGAVTGTAQTQRLASSVDMKAFNLVLERASKLSGTQSPLEQLRTIVADPATDPAKQGKSVTQAYRNVISQAKEIVAQGDEAQATLFMHNLEQTVAEHAQIDLFPQAKDIKQAQQTYKNVTAQHIVEANRAAAKAGEDEFKLTPTGPKVPGKPQTDYLKDQEKAHFATIKEHQAQDMRVSQGTSAAQPIAPKVVGFTTGKGSTYAIAPDGTTTRNKAARPEHPGDAGPQPASEVTFYVTKENLNKLAEFQTEGPRKALEVLDGQAAIKYLDGPSQGKFEKRTLVNVQAEPGVGLYPIETWRNGEIVHFGNVITEIATHTPPSATRKPFKLTPPEGGASRPRKPSQLDLLNVIAAEPQPEQLAIEMANSIQVGNPELSKQFLSMVKGAQEALATGNQEKIGKALQRIQNVFEEKTKPAVTDLPRPQRLVETEKKALQQFFVKTKGQNLSPTEMLKAFAADPTLQPDHLIAIFNNMKNPTWRDAAQHLIINSLLTPSSDFVNFVSTGINVGMHVGARSMGQVSGQAARLLGGKAGVYIGEDRAMMHGLYSSFWDSVKLAGRVLKTAKPELGPAALREEALKDNPLHADAMFGYSPTARRFAGIDQAPTYDSASYPTLSRAGAVTHAINFFATAAGLPGRLMMTGDQFMQSMAMNAEISALTLRQGVDEAVRQGLSESEFRGLYRPLRHKILQDIPDDIRKKGEEFALDAALLKELGPLGSSVMHLRDQANQYTGVGGTVALPFFKTLINNAKATWEFSPLAPISSAIGRYGATHEGALASVAKQYRDDMFGTDPVKRDIAVGKWSFGTMVMSTMLWAGFEGRLTGRGPDNPELRKAGYQAYGQPDSFIYNTDTGERIQIKRLGAFANLAGMAADAAEIWPIADDQTKADVARLMVTAYVSNLDMDFMMNSVTLAEALMSAGKKEKDFGTIAASATAAIPLAGTLRAVETAVSEPRTVKEARDAMDRILARFPGYDWAAKKFGLPAVPVERNLFGDAVKRDRAWFGTEWFNPLIISKPSGDPLMQEFSRIYGALKMELGQPSNITGKNNLRLSDAEYDRYKIIAGRNLRERIAGIMDNLQDPYELDQVKRDLVQREVSLSRQQATRELLDEMPDLTDALTEDRIYRYTVPRTPKRSTRISPPSLIQE